MSKTNDLTEYARKFIKALNKSSSRHELAQRMGMSMANASQYASYLRRRGLKLKKFPAGRPRQRTSP